MFVVKAVSGHHTEANDTPYSLVFTVAMVKDLSHPSPHFPGSKRFRPPRIDLSRTVEKKIGPIIHIDPNSPVLRLEHDNSTFEETLQLSDSDTSDSELAGGGSSTHTVNVTSANDLLPDDISKDLAALQQLRQNVKKNLQLRPIRSRSNLPKVKIDINDDIQAAISKSLLTQGSIHDMNPPSSAFSPTSATSSYFTPIDYTPFSAIFPANGTKVDDLSVCTTDYSASPISPRILYERLLAPRRPLVIDTRPLAAHQSFNLKHSINIAIPSLILKRCRKPGGGLQSLDALRPFTTTEQATSRWDSLMCPGGPWDGDVIVYDDEMNPRDKDNLGITAWAIIPVIQPLLTHGSVFYLEGGFLNGGHHPDLQGLIMTGDEDKFETSNEIGSYQTRVDSHPPSEAKSGGSLANKRKVSLGLFQLDTNVATRSQRLPEIEPESTISTNPPSSHLRSPLLMPSTTSDSSDSSQNTSKTDASLSSLSISTATPSPPPSSVGFRKQQPSRRPSVPNLRRLDTKSAERLRDTPKLSVRTKPMRSATLSVPPPALSLNYLAPPHSPTHLNLRYSNHAPSPTPALLGGNNPFSPTKDPANYLTPYYTPPHTPRLPRLDEPPEPPRTPLTARPDMDPPTTDESCPMFTISTILPNFLFLGPELTTPEHVEELKGLGVKRILNIAAECDDDNGLNLRGVFEKYYKIPMRDTVEEDNITKGVREVCDILGEPSVFTPYQFITDVYR